MNASKVVRTIGPPVLFGIVFLLLWEGLVRAFDIQKFLLPAPSAILRC